jgi:DASH complex subunit SPC19
MLRITVQVFLLVDEGTVEKYKADLSDEIEPQITELMSRAEKGMKALQRTQLALQTKVRLVFFVPWCIFTEHGPG